MENACGCDKIRQIVKVVPLDEEGIQEIQAFSGESVSEVLQPESPLFVSVSAQSGGENWVTIDKLVCQLREQTGIEFHHQFRHTYDELSVRWDESVSCDDADTSQVGTEFPTVHEGTDQQAAEAAFYETKRRKRKTEPPLKSSGTALRHRKADGIKICGKSAGAKWKIGFD